jgi:hypothetical protein
MRASVIGANARAGVLRDATVEAYADRLLEVCRAAAAR